MKLIKSLNPYNCSVAIVLSIIFILNVTSSICYSAEFVSLEIYPKHVGIFIQDGKQQFVAFGITNDGNRINITKEVSWHSSNSSLVTIDGKGLASVKAGVTAGQVMISCNYPKSGGGLSPVIGSLLRPSFPVTASIDVSADFGDISPPGESLIKRGNTLTLDLTPDNNYEVVASAVGGSCPPGNIINNYTQYQTGSITEACDVIIPFSQKPTITPTIDTTNNQGTISPDGSLPVYAFTGSYPEFLLTPSIDYDVSETETANDQSTDCPGLTFSGLQNKTMTVGPIISDCSIKVHFSSLPSFTVSSSSAGNGTIDPQGPISVKKYSQQTYNLTPDTDFIVSHVSESAACPQGSLIPASGNTYTYRTGEITQEGCAVTAHFSDNSITVDASVSSDPATGSVTPLQIDKVVGTQAVFTLSPSPGFTVSLDSDACGTGGFFSNNFLTYTTAPLTDNCSVIFNFIPTTYLLSVSAVGDGGVHTGSLIPPAQDYEILCYQEKPQDDISGCTETYNYGDIVILKAQENILTGSSFVSWQNCPDANSQTCTITMDENKIITAIFSN